MNINFSNEVLYPRPKEVHPKEDWFHSPMWLCKYCGTFTSQDDMNRLHVCVGCGTLGGLVKYVPAPTTGRYCFLYKGTQQQ
jgi:hypothetical protein